MVFILFALWWIRIRGLWKFPDGRDWLKGKLSYSDECSDEFSKSLIHFSPDGQGCIPSLLLDLRPNYGGVNEGNNDLLQKVPWTHCCTQCLWLWSRPPPTHASPGYSWTLTGKSGSVFYEGHCSFLLGPGAHKVLFVPSKSLFPQFCVRVHISWTLCYMCGDRRDKNPQAFGLRRIKTGWGQHKYFPGQFLFPNCYLLEWVQIFSYVEC